MKKRIVPVLLCAAIVFTLAGCGNSSKDEEESATQEETEKAAVDITEEEPAEEETAENEESVVDQVEEFRYGGTEDNIAFWSIYMKEDADYDDYMDGEYTEILKACLEQSENKEDGAIFYGIQGFDMDGQIVFSWDDYGTEDEAREVKQFIWRGGQTNPETYKWQLSGEELQDIYSGLDE